MHLCAHQASSKHKGSAAEPKNPASFRARSITVAKALVQSKHTVTHTEHSHSPARKNKQGRNTPPRPSPNTWGCTIVTKKLEPWPSSRCWEVSRAADNFIRRSYSSQTSGAEISCGNWNCQMWGSITRSRELSFEKENLHRDTRNLQ